MIRSILIGHGRMGQMIEQAMARAGDFELMGVVDVGLFEKPEDVPGQPDVLVDFSYPGNLEKALAFAVERGCPLVLGTTGYSEAQLTLIREAAKKTADRAFLQLLDGRRGAGSAGAEAGRARASWTPSTWRSSRPTTTKKPTRPAAPRNCWWTRSIPDHSLSARVRARGTGGSARP